MTTIVSSPIPIAPTRRANSTGDGSMCGRGDELSFTLSRSNRTAPGMWPARNSASASRFCAGKYQEPSTMTTFGSSRCSCRRAGVTKMCVMSDNPFASIHKRHPHAAVLLAFLLDVGHRHRADLAGSAHVRSTARLQVDSLDGNKAHFARSARRFYRHGLDEARIGIELRVGDPALGDGGVAGNQRVELVGDVDFVETRIRNVEIEPPVTIRNRATGHRIRQNHTQQMKRRVDAHAPVAALPI